jgi:uncharacterized protein YdaU (DUF1376 family)
LNKYLNIEISAYLNESRSMTAAARGAYLDLMVHACQNNGVVPRDEAKLRKIARCRDAYDWNRVREQVLAVMEPVEDGYLIHHAATSSDRYRLKVEEARAKGRASATARANGTHTPQQAPHNIYPTTNATKSLKSLSGTQPNNKLQNTNSKGINNSLPKKDSVEARPPEQQTPHSGQALKQDGKVAAAAGPFRTEAAAWQAWENWRAWRQWPKDYGPCPGEAGCLISEEQQRAFEMKYNPYGTDDDIPF